MYSYIPRPQLLKNRNILITGAGQGIGKAIAISCASMGARVILLGKTASKLEAVNQIIIKQNYLSPIVVPFDLETAQTQHYLILANKLKQQISCLNGLLHNAAIAIQLKPIAELSEDDFKRVMHINVNAVFSLTHHLLPLLKKATDASILFTSSSVGRKGRSLWGAYASSKFAIEGLMQCLADELKGTNIRANSINPGATRTAMRALVYPDEITTNNPLPEEILAAYLYLLGPDSLNINGQAFNAQ